MSQMTGFNAIFGQATDEHWSNVAILIPFDSGFADVKGNTVTHSGGAIISSSAARWGANGLTTDTDAGNVDIAYDLITALNNGSGTIDFWINGVDNGSYQYIFSTEDSGGSQYSLSAALLHSGVIEIYIATDTSYSHVTLTGTTSVLGGWHFVRITKNGADWELYIDGVLDNSLVSPTANLFQSNSVIHLLNRYATVDTARDFTSKLDDFRVTVGIVRDGSEVPSSAFPTS